MRASILVISSLITLAGCFTVSLPGTIGEQASGYGYIPIDPLAVDEIPGHDSCGSQQVGIQQGQLQPQEEGAQEYPYAKIEESLPDFSIRFAVAESSGSFGLQYGATKTTVKGKSYRAVLDYTNVDVIPVEMLLSKKLKHVGWVPPSNQIKEGDSVIGYDARVVRVGYTEPKSETKKVLRAEDLENYETITFPIYVGIGLRLSAEIEALKSGISLSGLSVIGAQADAENLTGTLTFQTLGVAGSKIGNAMPVPSKLDQTTIENSILALGTSRSLIYNTQYDDVGDIDNSNVIKKPRAVGIYSPIGSDPLLINAVYSALSANRIPWERPCKSY